MTRRREGEIYIGDGEYITLEDLKRFLKEAGYKLVKIQEEECDCYSLPEDEHLVGCPYYKNE